MQSAGHVTYLTEFLPLRIFILPVTCARSATRCVITSMTGTTLNLSVFPRSRDRISVLTVLCNRREQSELVRLLSHSNWDIHCAQSLVQAAAFLRTVTVGVVVAQYQPCGEYAWRKLLEETWRVTPAPRLIVTDRLADESMWAEVLNLGAHDLIVQPFVPRDVFHVITCAWHSWKGERSLHSALAKGELKADAA